MVHGVNQPYVSILAWCIDLNGIKNIKLFIYIYLAIIQKLVKFSLDIYIACNIHLPKKSLLE
jgi:hypothetical protein